MSPDARLLRSLNDLEVELYSDQAVKLAGVDVDGVLRGKLVSKSKFLSVAETGFGFCSVIFGWDMHDVSYFRELKISNKENGYRDILAIPDLSSFRRIPWEDNVPFFLVSFFDPDTMQPLCACPRGLLKKQLEKLDAIGVGAAAGAEYEFFQFRTPEGDGPNASTAPVATFLRDNPAHSLPPLTEGMFGYSLTRPIHNQKYFYEIFGACDAFECNLEGWHTESGPGVFEAALAYQEIREMADRACLFKYTVKSIATKYGITPCFMAKPKHGLPGNSGHMHVSLRSHDGSNLLARDTPDPEAQYPDLVHLSDMGRHFLAGILDGLPDVMPMLAPTVNSYKRLIENFWAPVTVSWGLEHRSASIRLIAPPTKLQATRLEVRVPGADSNPYFVLSAILALGWRGIETKLAIPCAPLGKHGLESDSAPRHRLAKTLREANKRFTRPESVARELFGNDFVDHFGGTRDHELQQWEEAVTDWEVRRYIETI